MIRKATNFLKVSEEISFQKVLSQQNLEKLIAWKSVNRYMKFEHQTFSTKLA